MISPHCPECERLDAIRVAANAHFRAVSYTDAAAYAIADAAADAAYFAYRAHHATHGGAAVLTMCPECVRLRVATDTAFAAYMHHRATHGGA